MSKTLSARNRWCPAFVSLQVCLGSIFALLLTPQAAQGAADKTTLAATQSLDFGTFAVLPSCINCSITISPAGIRSVSGGVVLSSKNLGKAAQYSVTCNNASCPYTQAIAGSATFSATGGVTMTVGTFTFAKNPINTTSTLSVGATLTISKSGTAASTYTSTSFTLTTSP